MAGKQPLLYSPYFSSPGATHEDIVEVELELKNEPIAKRARQTPTSLPHQLRAMLAPAVRALPAGLPPPLPTTSPAVVAAPAVRALPRGLPPPLRTTTCWLVESAHELTSHKPVVAKPVVAKPVWDAMRGVQEQHDDFTLACFDRHFEVQIPGTTYLDIWKKPRTQEIWDELKADGYAGSISDLARWLYRHFSMEKNRRSTTMGKGSCSTTNSMIRIVHNIVDQQSGYVWSGIMYKDA